MSAENAKLTDPAALSKQLELAEHIKKGTPSTFLFPDHMRIRTYDHLESPQAVMV
jgi:hypothetical protein